VRNRALDVATRAALFVVAFGLRALPFPDLLRDGRLVLYGNDAWYHARRIRYGAERFPDVLDFDPYLNFPHGGEPIWGPLFDFVLAALTRLGGLPADGGVPGWIVWVPPLLGAATVVAIAWAGARRFGRGVGLGAGLLLAVLPAHVGYTRVGFVDHHAAVALASAAIVIVALEAFARLEAGQRVVARGAAAGALLGGALLLWPGMLLEVGAFGLAVAAAWLARDGDRARRAAVFGAAAFATATVAVAPFAWGREWAIWGTFSPVVLTRFQPWLLGLAAAGLAGGAALAPRLPGRGARLAVGAGLAVMLASASAAWLPDPAGALGDAWQWLAKREAFQAGVLESRGLFAFGWARPVEELSGFVLLVPLLLAAPLVDREASSSWAGRVLVAFVAALFAATCVQSRFKASLAPAFCLLVAWGAARVAARGRAARALVATACALFVLPALLGHLPAARAFAAWAAGGAPARAPLDQRRDLLLEVGTWLRAHTPETAGWLDPAARPAYGVLARWFDGHRLLWQSRRPMAVGNFGDDVGRENLPLAEAYYAATSEAEASRILERLGVRYVLFEHWGGEDGDLPPGTLGARLFFGDGSAGEPALGVVDLRFRRAAPFADAVEHHRLVYETGPKPWRRRADPGFKVYEHVAGARLAGTAAPGATVEAALPLATPSGRRFTFRVRALAGADGRFALRLPYATAGGDPAGVRAEGPLLVTSAGRRAAVDVPESAVRTGDVVAVAWDAAAADQGASPDAASGSSSR
jgi:dolichyl-diphosphooligosaccharide--protein glycosyltransferase